MSDVPTSSVGLVCETGLCLKDTDSFTKVLQVPVDGPQTVPQLIGTPVQLVPTHLRTQTPADS